MSQRLAKKIDFSRPMLGFWRIDGFDSIFSGTILLKNSWLELRVILRRNLIDDPEENDPIFQATKAPNRIACFGDVQSLGRISLIDCIRSEWHGVDDYKDNSQNIELVFKPVRAWVGTDFLINEEKFEQIEIGLKGLHSIFGNSSVRRHLPLRSDISDDSIEIKLRELTDARDVYFVHHRNFPTLSFNFRDSEYNLSFETSIHQSSSSINGISIKTFDSILIKTSAKSIEDLIIVKDQVIQFLSFLCIAQIIPQWVSVAKNDHERPILLGWSLGEKPKRKTAKRMAHEITLDIRKNPTVLFDALEKWFSATEDRQLARWLVYDTLGKTTFSIARFLAVTQAWEIAGREERANSPIERQNFLRFCEKIAAVCEKELPPEMAARFIALNRSSNKESFSSMFARYLSYAPKIVLDKICGNDLDKFVSIAGKVRNTLTHLEGRREFTVDFAAGKSLFLTYKLTVLFCIIEIDRLVEIGDHARIVLGNNGMAKAATRPLPD